MGDGLDAPGTFVRNHALNRLELFSIMLYILVLLWLPRVHQILPKDKAMKDAADSFTASLPRKGSYDFSQDQEKTKEKS